jgi:hypothetical protein
MAVFLLILKWYLICAGIGVAAIMGILLHDRIKYGAWYTEEPKDG